MTSRHQSRYHQLYDYERTWEGTKPGWYSIEFLATGPTYNLPWPNSTDHAKYSLMVDWLYANIDNPERHCRWHQDNVHAAFKFRYERDYIWFKLVWE